MAEEMDETTERSSPKSSGGNFLTHKVGPLPVYGWVVLVVAGLLVYRWTKNGGLSNLFGSGTTTSAGDTASSAPTTPDTTTTPTAVAQASNLSWEYKMRTALLSLGYAPSLVDESLQKYLSGEGLNATQEGVIHAGINLVGNAPVKGNFGHYVPPPSHHETPRAHGGRVQAA